MPLRMFLLFVLACPVVGHAALLSADLFTPGDGLITRESESGREWVDVTATINQSINSVTAGYGGFVNIGFRVATLSEVGNLFQAAGIPNLTSPSHVQENFASGFALMELIGCGAQCSLPWRYTEGFALYEPDHPTSAARAYLFLDMGTQAASVRFGDGVNGFPTAGGCGKDCADPWEGVWLVRDSVSPIPEPITFWLLAAGLLGLASCWQRFTDRSLAARRAEPSQYG